MRVAVVCRSDSTGGAAVVSRRLTEALLLAGADAKMIVEEKLTDFPFAIKTKHLLRGKLAFILERIQILLACRGDRKNLFKADTAAFGLPLHKNPIVKNADIVILNWVNQGMLSLREIEKICFQGKRVVWIMHDMWNITGICHHAMKCTGFIEKCGNCPLLGKGAFPKDLSYKTHLRKNSLYQKTDIRFVAVSNWLANEARKSSLMKNREVEVVPNAIRIIPENDIDNSLLPPTEKRRILFAAASLDNWIKGLDTFRNAINRLKRKNAISSDNCEVVLMGNLKDPASIKGFEIPVVHTGMITDERVMAGVYSRCDVIVNTSEFENLPGTLVEGQAYGAIPVAFNRGGQGDIITHKETGWLAPWADEIEERSQNIADGIEWALGESRANRNEIKSRMRRNVEEKFSYQAVATLLVRSVFN